MILASVAKFLLRLCLLQLQNLEVKDTIIKIIKTKTEIKKELEDSIINGRKNEDADIQDIYKIKLMNVLQMRTQ